MASQNLAVEKSEDQNIRIVLVGKTGVGKSATGNTILQKKAFVSKMSLSSLTEECQKETGEFEGQPLAVIDTPGLFDTKKPEKEVVAELARCISMSAPGPHVFLVVIQPNRFTEEEQKTVQLIKKIFGEKAPDYTMALFTHGDDLEAEGMSVEELIETDEKVRFFVNQCGGGYHLFNNRSEDPSQVRELLEKINTMVEKNGGRYYTTEMFEEVYKTIEEEMMAILRINPDMEADEARKRAERDNLCIRWVMEYVVAGAQRGAAFGRPLGPVVEVNGASLGAALGLLVGDWVATFRALNMEHQAGCVLL